MKEENDPRSALPVFSADIWTVISKQTDVPDFANLRRSCYALYTHQRISQEFNRRRWIYWYGNNEYPFDEHSNPHANIIWNHCLRIAREAPDAQANLARISHHIALREPIPNNGENWPPELAAAINTIINLDEVHIGNHEIDALIVSIETLNGVIAPQHPINSIEQRERFFATLKTIARYIGFSVGGIFTGVGILLRTVGHSSNISYANILLGVGTAGIFETISNRKFRQWCHAKFFQPAPRIIDEEMPLIAENANTL
ncbi:MAG TPA: hypothetical protein VGV92_07370 [Gammaproteobacteria bacterium]|nr:hypothetical protein [Gammaproteobacteria bacterium]